MKRLLCFLLILGWCIDSVHAQLHLNAKLQNNHLWRGMEVADGIVLLTDFNYSMADNHVTVGLWGGVNSEGSYKEFNHYLSLKAGGWHLDLWDTYNFSPGATYNNKQYWNYSAHETGRFLDMTVGYRFDKKKIPLALSWSTVVFGRDRNSDNTQQKYSTFVYAECQLYNNNGWKVDTGRRRCTLLRHQGGNRTYITTGRSRPETGELHYSCICQWNVEPTEQSKLFPTWGRNNQFLI